MATKEITSGVRTRMEGGVEQLEAVVLCVDRLVRALDGGKRLTESLQAWRNAEALAADAARRGAKFPELTGLLAALSRERASLDQRVGSALRELRVPASGTLDDRLAALAPHLPIVYRGTLESSGLVWAGVVVASLFGATAVLSTWPWLAAAPIAAGIGGMLWDRARSRTLLVSQQLLVVGTRAVPLTQIREIVVPPGVGAYRCRLDIDGGTSLELPAITPLLDILRKASVEVRFE